MSAALAFQKVSRVRLAADTAVSALVPAAHIFDANERPEVFPCIRLGEDQELPGDDVVGRYTKLFATLHIWNEEPGLAGVKSMSDAVRRCLRGQRWSIDGYRCLDTSFVSARFLRDPTGIAHAVVTFEAVIEEFA
jgi:hypothetical protein